MNSFDIVADRDLRAPLPESFCFIDGENETQMGKNVPRDPQGLEDPNYRLLLLRKKKNKRFRGSQGTSWHGPPVYPEGAWRTKTSQQVRKYLDKYYEMRQYIIVARHRSLPCKIKMAARDPSLPCSYWECHGAGAFQRITTCEGQCREPSVRPREGIAQFSSN